jgi:hypothetical protein
VEKHEKLAQRSVSPVHEHRLTFNVGKPPLQILLRKTLYSLFESNRGLLDLQFSYSKFGQLLFKLLEIFEFKQGANNTVGQGCRRATMSCAQCAALRAPRPRVGPPRHPRPRAARRPSARRPSARRPSVLHREPQPYEGPKRRTREGGVNGSR